MGCGGSVLAYICLGVYSGRPPKWTSSKSQLLTYTRRKAIHTLPALAVGTTASLTQSIPATCSHSALAQASTLRPRIQSLGSFACNFYFLGSYKQGHELIHTGLRICTVGTLGPHCPSKDIISRVPPCQPTVRRRSLSLRPCSCSACLQAWQSPYSALARLEQTKQTPTSKTQTR